MNADLKGIVKDDHLSNILIEFLLSHQLGGPLSHKDIERVCENISKKLNPEFADLTILKRIVEKLESQGKL